MLLLKDIKQIVTPKSKKPLSGDLQKKIKIYKNCSIFIEDGKIKSIGKKDKILKDFPQIKKAKEIECKNFVAFPGFIDCHTHLVFAGERRNEFYLKLKGIPYMEIAKRGGGILYTLKKVRKISFDNLYEESFEKLKKAISFGTVAVEIKSGYGLNLKDEIKQLRVIKKLRENLDIEVIPTLMAAHEIPPEFKNNRKGYIELIINEIIPKVSEENLALFCDVFCEKGVFTEREAELILKKAKEAGLKLKIHADEFEDSGGAKLAGSMGCISAEHLAFSSEEGIKEMGRNGVIAVLLPGVSFFLKSKKIPPVDLFKKHNVPIALGSDFNPGSSPNLNIQFVLKLAVFIFGLLPEEALNAITLNSAFAVDLGDKKGSIEEGKDGDILLFEMENWLDFFYYYGENFLKYNISKGKILWKT